MLWRGFLEASVKRAIIWIDEMKKLTDIKLDSYQRILDQIASNQSLSLQFIAKRVLYWVTASFRPLREYEIEAGVALHPGTTVLNNRSKVQKNIVDLCYPILERRPGGLVELVHFSAKE
jgi:hypothetical protein